MFLLLFLILAIIHAYPNISKDMPDIYATLEGEYSTCYAERTEMKAPDGNPMTLARAAAFRLKIKECVNIGEELVRIVNDHPELGDEGVQEPGKSHKWIIDLMRKDIKQLDEFMKSGDQDQLGLFYTPTVKCEDNLCRLL